MTQGHLWSNLGGGVDSRLQGQLTQITAPFALWMSQDSAVKSLWGGMGFPFRMYHLATQPTYPPYPHPPLLLPLPPNLVLSLWKGSLC